MSVYGQWKVKPWEATEKEFTKCSKVWLDRSSIFCLPCMLWLQKSTAWHVQLASADWPIRPTNFGFIFDSVYVHDTAMSTFYFIAAGRGSAQKAHGSQCERPSSKVLQHKSSGSGFTSWVAFRRLWVTVCRRAELRTVIPIGWSAAHRMCLPDSLHTHTHIRVTRTALTTVWLVCITSTCRRWADALSVCTHMVGLETSNGPVAVAFKSVGWPALRHAAYKMSDVAWIPWWHLVLLEC